MQSDRATRARRMLDTLDACTQIDCPTETDPALDLAEAYRIGAEIRRLRELRGERPVGRKLGFTNTTIWEEYNVDAPFWAPVYNTTVQPLPDRFALKSMAEPRLEPEIVLRLGRSPEAGMSEAELIGCVGEVAHGFEVVQSPFPGWRFRAPDTVAACGLHGALLHGPFHPLTDETRDAWRAGLADFSITLHGNGVLADEGHSANVLSGGPLAALAHLVELLAQDPDAPPLAAGEVVTTGTLTRALPVARGETWRTEITGLPVEGLRISFA